MDGGLSADFKPLNKMKLSWLVQVLLNFYGFQGSLRGGGSWVDGVGVDVGVQGLSYALCNVCMYMHECTHAHTHMHMHVKHDKHGCLHVGGHLQFLYMYTCGCVHVHVCMCVGTPPCPQITSTHLPPPQSCREPKTPKSNKSWTNQYISIVWRFFTSEHSWTHIDYSWSPWILSTHLPYPQELKKPKSEE